MAEQKETKQPRNLVKKLAKVMKEVEYIQKRGVNERFGYKYATESDVADAVRKVLAEQNVVMIPSVIERDLREVNTKTGTAFIATLVMEFTFIDGDTGDTISFRIPGEGLDVGDKAVYKAITGCQKYALMKAFLIPTGDDPEIATETESELATPQPKTVPKPVQGGSGQSKDRPATQKQIAAIHAMAKGFGLSDQQRATLIQAKTNSRKSSTSELTVGEASDIITYMKGFKNSEELFWDLLNVTEEPA